MDAEHTPSYTGQLHLSTSGFYADHDQMFAVGYLEGYISASEHLPVFCWVQTASDRRNPVMYLLQAVCFLIMPINHVNDICMVSPLEPYIPEIMI